LGGANFIFSFDYVSQGIRTPFLPSLGKGKNRTEASENRTGRQVDATTWTLYPTFGSWEAIIIAVLLFLYGCASHTMQTMTMTVVTYSRYVQRTYRGVST